MYLTIRNIVFLFVVSSLFSSCFTVKNSANFTYEKLSPDAYEKALSSDTNYYLIDVRTPKEYQKAHIKNAKNFNFLAFHFGRDVDSLDREKTAFLYCHTCHRSPFAAKEMKKRGFGKVYDLEKGFSNWIKKEKPVEN